MNHHPSTTLASAEIHHDTITIELLEPVDLPPMVRVVWPMQASIIDPKSFGDTAAAVVKLFSEAHVALAAIRVWKKL